MKRFSHSCDGTVGELKARGTRSRFKGVLIAQSQLRDPLNEWLGKCNCIMIIGYTIIPYVKHVECFNVA